MGDILQYAIYPAMLIILGKWIDWRINKNKEAQEKLLKQQMEELAKRQQLEAERDLKIEQLQDGIRAVLRDRILQSCNYFIERGSITPLALENITLMHDSYKELHGNGLCDRQFEAVNKLQVDTFFQQGGIKNDKV